MLQCALGLQPLPLLRLPYLKLVSLVEPDGEEEVGDVDRLVVQQLHHVRTKQAFVDAREKFEDV